MRLTPNIRSALKIVSRFYFVVIVVAVAISLWRFDELNSSGFWVSAIASLWEDIIFFGLVGLAAIVVSLRRPQDETIDTRLWYLFSSPKITKRVMQYNAEVFEKLAGFASRGHIRIQVSEYDPLISCYKVHVDNEWEIQNTFENRVYEDKNLMIRVVPDHLERAPQGVLGGVGPVRITHDNGKIDRIIDHDFNIYKEYDTRISLRIDPNGSATYEYHFWVWASIGQEFFIATNRFAENVTIELHNRMTGIDLRYREIGDKKVKRLKAALSKKLK